MQRELPASSLTTSRYLTNSLPSLLGPIQFVSAYIKISISSGVMHSRFLNLSEACRTYYTSCRNVAGIFFIKKIGTFDVVAYQMAHDYVCLCMPSLQKSILYDVY
jgi:hypothetical protein